ncbi:MAG: DUF444 family protein [Planctomycetes bacterium]|nr:DUF444 family protein [Planctomycetota bacterium]
MVHRIDNDHSRFRDIVRGAVRENLRKYISRSDIVTRRGEKSISIPIPQIDIPKFKYGSKDKGGVGMGEGEVGDLLGNPDDGDGHGHAGEGPGDHALEVEFTLEELAKILGEELELPNIQPKGRKNITAETDKYTGIRPVGPESLRHFKRTFKQALKRQIAAGTYDAMNPSVIPIREDRRYRAWTVKEKPEYNAVTVYMMDVSGSMGDEQKEMVRIETFWIDTWLRSQYKHLDVRYIVHDATAKEVDEYTFYHLRESGGTKISSAYELCHNIIHKEYPAGDWNIYPFHFSDGDNWSTDDTEKCIDLLSADLIPVSNMFCYGQVRSVYGSGKFKSDLDEAFGLHHEKVITSDIHDKDHILGSIKEFLGKGK